MKTAKEIYVDKRIRIVLKCTLCGSTTYVKAGIDTKTSKDAIKLSCRAFTPFKGIINESWWKEFGLKKNPYVYGPMPRLRTEVKYRTKRQGVWAENTIGRNEDQRNGVTPRRRYDPHNN